MANSVKIRETSEFINGQGARDEKEKSRRKKKKQAETDFAGKTFDTLTGNEKDDLLKVLAISAGILEE